MHLKMMLVEAALKRHVAAIGDCSGAFFQSLSNPDRTESQVWIEPPQEAELGPDNIWEENVGHVQCERSRVSIGAPKPWKRTVRTFSRVPWRWNNHDTTVACFIVLNNAKNTLRRKQADTQMTFCCNRTGTERRTLSGAGARQTEHARCSAFVRQTSSHLTELPQHSEWITTQQPSFKKPSARKHQTATMNNSDKRMLARNVPQSSSSRHSAQRENTFQDEEEFDDSNAKAQEAYPLLACHW